MTAHRLIYSIVATVALAGLVAAFFPCNDVAQAFIKLLSPAWAILLTGAAGWSYFRHQNTAAAYQKYYDKEMLECRMEVDHWVNQYDLKDLNEMWSSFSDPNADTAIKQQQMERYYKVLRFAMLMQHISVSVRNQSFGMKGFLFDIGISDKTIAPNIAANFLRLATFIRHRRLIQGKDIHKELYLALEDEACEFLIPLINTGSIKPEPPTDAPGLKSKFDSDDALTKSLFKSHSALVAIETQLIVELQTRFFKSKPAGIGNGNPKIFPDKA